ncbi:hypothetical protein [Candidatus Odyssella thessalonicensis]|uniref:hypothetical protein n=1 Tax=Candidatus Odyssella thessalonicensis TaxID=84647 RepID=UPI0004980C16|nr:hypothetical protein [Candidatus Odyssella thessalonicensis]
MVQFWKLWAEKYPETLSARNLAAIYSKIAPKVDNQWLQYFPEHQHYVGRTLVHHHIEHNHLTTALPDKLHGTAPGRSMFHANLGGKKKND